jgi:hypothetical protein
MKCVSRWQGQGLEGYPLASIVVIVGGCCEIREGTSDIHDVGLKEEERQPHRSLVDDTRPATRSRCIGAIGAIASDGSYHTREVTAFICAIVVVVVVVIIAIADEDAVCQG